MRRLLTVAVILGLLLTALPTAALAGDPHAVRNRWAGVGIGVAVATMGGLLLSSIHTPVVVAPPVVYMPPPVYAPPVVHAPPPPVIYSPPPVVVYKYKYKHRIWGHPGHWKRHYRR